MPHIFFRRNNNEKGMTLVEVIVGMALLGIITATVLMIFSTGLLLAIKSGDNTNVTGDASTQMNKQIVKPVDGTSMNAVVKFKQQVGNSVNVPGQLIITEAASEHNESTMKSFVPD